MRFKWNSVSSSLGIWIFLLAFLSGVVKGVYIKELRVPQSVVNGTDEPAILDCEYTIEDNEKPGLVVKWFFNRGGTPVYQWVLGQKPQGLGILRDRLNLDYIAPDAEDWGAHRALSINNPTTELTGEWLCRVSTFESEAMKTSRMTVFSPQKDMDIHLVSRPTPESINISCWANGVYPEPKLTITYGNNKLEEVFADSMWSEGAYNVVVHKIIEDSDLTLPVIFDCELKIPNTSYIHRKNLLYGGPKAETVDNNGNETGGASTMTSVGAFFYVNLIVMWLLFRRT